MQDLIDYFHLCLRASSKNSTIFQLYFIIKKLKVYKDILTLLLSEKALFPEIKTQRKVSVYAVLFHDFEGICHKDFHGRKDIFIWNIELCPFCEKGVPIPSEI